MNEKQEVKNEVVHKPKAIVFYYERALTHRDLPDALYDEKGEELKTGWYFQENNDEAPRGPFNFEKEANTLAKKADATSADATKEVSNGY